MTDFVNLLKSNNSFFDQKIQRDADEALILLLDIFNHVCELQINDNDIHYIPQFMGAFFAGIYKITFICELCGENNVYFENFCQITLQPDTDINHYFKNDHKENKHITCNK